MVPAMTRQFDGNTLVIASHNTGKVREIGDLLNGRVGDVVSAGALGLTDPEETGDTFAANAELKAHFVASRAGRPALSDDSGLAVTALDGAPGIHTARWAERPDGVRDFADGMRRLQQRLDDIGAADRSAHFVCALCLAWPDGAAETVIGEVHGQLVWPPRGDRGFGFDPVFVPNGYDITFGEMDPVEKHRISHRADAFRKLIDRCFPI